jgi:hypothetical protein
LRQVAEQLSRETVLERAAAAAAFPPLAAAVVAPVLLPPPIPASAGADMPAVSATHKAKRINLFILPPRSFPIEAQLSSYFKTGQLTVENRPVPSKGYWPLMPMPRRKMEGHRWMEQELEQ